MRKRPTNFNTELARKQWDYAAEAFAELQASGNDYYRTGFFGPAQIDLCGDVSGLAVLDIGCGAGYFSRELSKRGAVVTAIDLSGEMIRIAQSQSTDNIRYQVLDAADIAGSFAPESFDLVTACVSLQDMPDPPAVMRSVHTVLKSGSRFVFCNTHPCTDPPYRKWAKDEEGKKTALEIAQYFDRGPIEFEWKRPQQKYGWISTCVHAPLSDWIKWTTAAGFKIKQIEEPMPTMEAVSRWPELEDARMVPYFIIFDVTK